VQYSRAEINRMKMDELRPLVQTLLQVADWPGDWDAAGQILADCYFNFQRANTGERLFGITLFGEYATGSGIDEDPLVAIYRAYVLMRLEDADLGRSMK
jgi:hypothetical protein